MSTADLNTEQRRLITDAVFNCYERAELILNKTFARPSLTFRRSGRNAGTAFLQQNRINFHPLLYRDNETQFLSDVVPHEVSHLVVWQLYGKVKPHGKEWQSIMTNVFDCVPSVTHGFTTSTSTKTFLYQCDCNQFNLTTRRHNRIVKGASYYCRSCKSILRKC
ncbi:SprT family zinc-dependent metalloprotease [Alteromonas sp. V450]|uniref:SprT family zinc-dependent metalloprotease n=1 Tax=Alteromonas sp. V450 TaxID=1912139 RepID=UPI0008FF7105|nr:SprT family zinc-dependent metalloprotease [Alteromonas sp. V450]